MATILSFGPFSAFYFMFYEKQKIYFQKDSPSFYWAMGFSTVAGCLASVLTNPLEIAKLRM